MNNQSINRHKSYCKESKGMKYEDSVNNRVFIASKLTDEIADGEINPNSKGRHSYRGLRKVGSRRVYFMFYCHDFKHDIQLVNQWKEYRVNPKTLMPVKPVYTQWR